MAGVKKAVKKPVVKKKALEKAVREAVREAVVKQEVVEPKPLPVFKIARAHIMECIERAMQSGSVRYSRPYERYVITVTPYRIPQTGGIRGVQVMWDSRERFWPRQREKFCLEGVRSNGGR